MGINQHTYLGLVIDAGDEDLAVFENKDQDLFCQPYCERFSKECRYWIPQQSTPSKICPDEFDATGPLRLEGLTFVPDASRFIEKHFPDALLQIAYITWWS